MSCNVSGAERMLKKKPRRFTPTADPETSTHLVPDTDRPHALLAMSIAHRRQTSDLENECVLTRLFVGQIHDETLVGT